MNCHSYSIWARVLKLLWCLYDPKGIDGWRILFVPLNFVNVGMPQWFYDLKCNSRLWIVTRIWYMSLRFEIIMMPLWAERNWRILFVPLNYDASMTRRILFVPLNYVASMTWKELTNIICPIKICKCWMPWWFYDLECNSKLWIITHIWYMSLSFDIFMMPLWPESNWQILFVSLNYGVSMTRKELTDIICLIKICKCCRIIQRSKSKHENQYNSYSKVTTRWWFRCRPILFSSRRWRWRSVLVLYLSSSMTMTLCSVPSIFNGKFLTLSWFSSFYSWIFINIIQSVHVGNFVVKLSHSLILACLKYFNLLL